MGWAGASYGYISKQTRLSKPDRRIENRRANLQKCRGGTTTYPYNPIYVCVYICILYVCIYICVYITYVCVCLYMHACMYVVRMCVCLFVCIQICAHVSWQSLCPLELRNRNRQCSRLSPMRLPFEPLNHSSSGLSVLPLWLMRSPDSNQNHYCNTPVI